MDFAPNTIFHIYNQGNNRDRVFFQEKNYTFFLQKMRTYLLPYGHFLCYCLMPNHFHWLFYVERLATPIENEGKNQPLVSTKQSSLDAEEALSRSTEKERTLNNAIAIVLRSYTQAVNKQEGRSGAIFRPHTKAKDGWEDPNLPPWHPQSQLVLKNWEIYGSTCFHYIHNNPVKAGLVAEATQWPWSSASDFAGIRNGSLCNQPLAKKLLQLP
jgi:putative transposase